jgi:hypothetical protein
MSYCRFENTLRDLQDCQNALEEISYTDGLSPLSLSEQVAARQLITLCRKIADEHGERVA